MMEAESQNECILGVAGLSFVSMLACVQSDLSGLSGN
jgi:hypothetical protein